MLTKIGFKAIFLAALAVLATGSIQQAFGQAQVQFTYDAAGNVLQVSRVGKPDLVVSSLAVLSVTQHPGGGYDIAATYTITNQGNVAASPTWYDRGYLSANATLHDTDQQLSGSVARSASLLPGASYSISTTYTAAAATASGTAYLIVKADGGTAASGQNSPTGPNVLDEADETNNVRAVAVALPVQNPDLVVTSASLGSIIVNQDGTYRLPITYTVTNLGGVTASPIWYDLAYLSTDSTLDNSDTNLSGFANHGSSLAVNASYTATTTFTASASTPPGNYTLFFKTDAHGSIVGVGSNTDSGAVAESIETNNVASLPATLPARPDLVVSSASLGAITVNQDGTYKIPLTYTVTNNGASAAQPGWYDVAYLSADSTLDNSDINLGGFGIRNSALAAGASYTVTTNFTGSATTPAGTYTLLIKADGHGVTVGGTNTDTGNVLESNDGNNTSALAITLPARPDLQLSIVSVGTITKNANGSYNIPVSYKVTNIGGSAAQPAWYDLAYISADATLDNSDVNTGGWASRGSVLNVGANYTNTVTFTTSTTTAAGTYTLFVKADAHGPTVGTGGNNTDGGAVAESNEVNNVAAVSITLP